MAVILRLLTGILLTRFTLKKCKYMKFGSRNLLWLAIVSCCIVTIISCCIVTIIIKISLVQAEEIAVENIEALTYFDSQGNSLPYRLLKPANYDPAKKYPLVLFLHGSGERGTDNHSHILSSKGAYEFINTAHDYAYFMPIPQCPMNDNWTEIEWNKLQYIMNAEPTESMRLVMELIEKVQGEFSIDPARIYATGLSMGGMGTWDLVIRKPKWFAAAITVCGGYDKTQASLIKNIPFLVFHGSTDPVVPVEGSRTMVKALKAVGARVEYVEYEGADHFIWERTYTDKKVIDWLFSQSKR